MPTANRAVAVAQRLAARLLEGGNFVFASPMSRSALTDVFPAAGQLTALDRHFEELGFAGLAVQSVGYEEGVDNPKVHIYVTKGPKQRENELPTQQGPVTIEINRVGRVVVKPETASAATHRGNLYERNNRIACGSSCAPSTEPYAGTLGTLVKKRGSQVLYVLSNNHVLAAANHVPVGMPILAPATMDARPGLIAPSEVCRHEDICELRSGAPALVQPQREDLAIGRVNDPARVTSWQGDGAEGYDTPHVIETPVSGTRVKKFGRTTGLTRGTIESRHLPFALPYTCRHFSATVWFQDVWSVRADPGEAFALPGDSGSLVVREDAGSSVGILFAVASLGQYGFIIPMDHVNTCFGGLTLVHGHGI
jgi:hypothetical protein